MSIYVFGRKHIKFIKFSARESVDMLRADFAASITTTGSERTYSGTHFSTLGSDCTLLTLDGRYQGE